MEPQQNAAHDSVENTIHSKAAGCLTNLLACVRTMRSYGRLHPTCMELVDATHKALLDALDLKPSITLVIDNRRLVLCGFPLDDGSGALASLADTLAGTGVGELGFSAGVSSDELAEFAEALGANPQDIVLRGGLARELGKRNVVNISVGGSVLPTESREGRDPADIYEEALFLVEEAMRAVESGLNIPVAEIRNVVSDSLRSLSGDDDALVALAGIRSYDRYLSEHSVNVCVLSLVMAREIGIETVTSLELGISAMLHDVGKVFVPAEVVKKPGRLDETEWEMIRIHPAEGARALAGVENLPVLAPIVALEHHSYCDGSGYPSTSITRSPHILSRLVSIVDTYDALTTDRPYRERWTGQKAVAHMMYETVGKYDAQLLAVFASRLGLYPPGSLVRLVGGELAAVKGGSTDHPTRPVLTLLSSVGSRGGAKTIDLSTNTDPAMEIDKMARPVEALLPLVTSLLAA